MGKNDDKNQFIKSSMPYSHYKSIINEFKALDSNFCDDECQHLCVSPNEACCALCDEELGYVKYTNGEIKFLVVRGCDNECN